MNLRLIHPAALTVLLFASCGKPPAPEGPPSDFPVAAVVARVMREPLEERVEMVGTVRATATVTLRSEIEGRVIDADFAEGMPVQKGTILFQLDTRREKALLAEAEARLSRARSDLERGKELLAKETIPAQEMDRLVEAVDIATAAVDLARANLEDAAVTAPFDGLVGERDAVPGQFVSRGDALATLTRMDPIEIEFRVPERFTSRVETGQAIRFQTPAWPDQDFAARVHYLDPGIESESRTLRVKAELPNPEMKLRPGMFGTITLVLDTRDAALLIPEAAIINRGDATLVVKVGGDNIASFQPVRTGMRQVGRIEITDGLAEGDRVVVEGHQKTRPGATILATPASLQYGVEPDSPPAAP